MANGRAGSCASEAERVHGHMVAGVLRFVQPLLARLRDASCEPGRRRRATRERRRPHLRGGALSILVPSACLTVAMLFLALCGEAAEGREGHICAGVKRTF